VAADLMRPRLCDTARAGEKPSPRVNHRAFTCSPWLRIGERRQQTLTCRLEQAHNHMQPHEPGWVPQASAELGASGSHPIEPKVGFRRVQPWKRARPQGPGIFYQPCGIPIPAGKNVCPRFFRSRLMNMAAHSIYIFEALTDIGVPADKARRVERELESSRSFDQNQFEKSLLERVMTKEDGLQLEMKLSNKMTALDSKIDGVKSDLNSKIDGVKGDVLVLKWMLGFVFASVLSLVMKAFFL
jgi:hypothetical protein